MADRAGYAPVIRYAGPDEGSGADKPLEEYTPDQLRTAILGLETTLAEAEGRLIDGEAESSVDGLSADQEGLER